MYLCLWECWDLLQSSSNKSIKEKNTVQLFSVSKILTVLYNVIYSVKLFSLLDVVSPYIIASKRLCWFNVIFLDSSVSDIFQDAAGKLNTRS